MNLASVKKLLKKSLLAEGKPWYDSFNSLLIVNQTMPYDIWRDAPENATLLTIVDQKGITISDGEKTLNPGDIISREDYYHKMWTNGGIQICAKEVSENPGDKYLEVCFNDNPSIKIKFTAYIFYIEADYKRDGNIVEPKDIGKDIPWTWGIDGYGPVLMVINEGDEDQEAFKKNGYRAFFNVKMKGPNKLPDKHAIILQTSDASSRKIAVYKKNDIEKKPFIGKGVCFEELSFDSNKRSEFFAFALQYPDRNFDGLISLAINLAIKNEEGKPIPVYYDAPEKSCHVPYIVRTQFRVSPWIMTPNTQKPQDFYAANVEYSYFDEKGYHSNEKFIFDLQNVYKDMKLVKPEFDRNDPWMQDELEFGYSQIPGNSGIFNVILHSPRDRGLALYPEKGLDKDVGHITRDGTGNRCSLDSFGNLEVTPPVVNYPLGRIIYGGCLPDTNGRRMMRVVRDFLEAQQVQKPLELFTDWLHVGHVDEMLTFVPIDAEPKFKLLLASPLLFFKLLDSMIGEEILFKGRSNIIGELMQKTVDQLKKDENLKTFNHIICQEKINENKKRLKDELGIKDKDIIDIPALFYPDKDSKASAYMPGMVNMVVLDKKLLIPDPCSDFIKNYVCKILSEFKCIFIDDWSSYHIQDGEVHCGTNVRREPLSTSWWNITLEKETVAAPEKIQLPDHELTLC